MVLSTVWTVGLLAVEAWNTASGRGESGRRSSSSESSFLDLEVRREDLTCKHKELVASKNLKNNLRTRFRCFLGHSKRGPEGGLDAAVNKISRTNKTWGDKITSFSKRRSSISSACRNSSQ